jgi:hypothetical protein
MAQPVPQDLVGIQDELTAHFAGRKVPGLRPLRDILASLEGMRSPAAAGEQVLVALIWALFLDGQHERCVAESKGAPHTVRESPKVLLCQANAFLELKAPEQALEALREARTRTPPGNASAIKRIDECMARAFAALPLEAALMKFPRTRHVFDAGGTGVGRDDLLMEMREVEQLFFSGQRVAVEEKIDGANLGLSIGPDGRILAQNRSHYVNASTHAQFRLLDQWIEEHTAALYEVLESQSGFILYGEWVYATHSIEYTRLPAYFLSFDIYDRKAGRFLSIAERDRRLEGSGIHSVPLICQRAFTNMGELLALLDTPSRYAAGFVEGIYLRVDGGGFLDSRAKLVRADFIQGITEHWMTTQLRRNTIDYATKEEEEGEGGAGTGELM